MSSNMKILKICEYCKQEFIARKTTSKTCSDDCAKRLYKLKQRSGKIHQAEINEEIKRRPRAFVTGEEIRAIQAKEFLTLKEVALLLNVSPLTLKRWVLTGKVHSNKIGKKHLIRKEIICN